MEGLGERKIGEASSDEQNRKLCGERFYAGSDTAGHDGMVKDWRFCLAQGGIEGRGW